MSKYKRKTAEKGKHYLFLIWISILFCSSNYCSFGQSTNLSKELKSFLKVKGIETMAKCAHIFNTYKEGSYELKGDIITININYDNGSFEWIQFHFDREGDSFDSVKVISGDDMPYSFVSTQAMISKKLLSDREKECLEKSINEKIENVPNLQLAAVILTNEWWKWRHKICK